jgi:K+-transporting ATPase c subunit
VLFKDKANGQLIQQNGQLIGSRILGQPFTTPEYEEGIDEAEDYRGDTSIRVRRLLATATTPRTRPDLTTHRQIRS